MEIEYVKQRKKVIEDNLLYALKDFEEDTKCDIVGLSLEVDYGLGGFHILRAVNIEVKI